MRKLPPLATADRNSPTFRPSTAGQCLDDLVSALGTSLGRVRRQKSSVHCIQPTKDWTLITAFTFLSRHSELSFEYQFVREDGKPIHEIGTGPFPQSLLLFYGLYNTTVVTVPSTEDSKPMAKAMAMLAGHFALQAPSLLVGLGVDD